MLRRLLNVTDIKACKFCYQPIEKGHMAHHYSKRECIRVEPCNPYYEAPTNPY